MKTERLPLTEETVAAYLDGELPPEQRPEFERLLAEHPEWRAMVAQQAEVIAALRPLKVRPPRRRVWDNYWEEIDAALGRRLGTTVAYAGAGLLIVAGATGIVLATPNPVLQVGEVLLFAGLAILFVTVLRGRLRELPKDRYKGIRK